MITKTMENEIYRLILPSQVTIDTIMVIFNELNEFQKIQPQPPLEIDFKDVETFDSSAIALFNSVKRMGENVIFSNIHEDMEKAFGMFPLTLETAKQIQKPGKRRYKKRIENYADRFLKMLGEMKEFVSLLTDEIYYMGQYLSKRKGVYPGEITNQLYFMAFKSFPIVTLISFLVGITISITSAEQLRNFGADIFLADLVGFAMIRELVPLMTGIILSGKIGASITAEIASMKVMEETDALKTMGIIPEKFLMVPRLMGITMAIPLLTALADFVGIFAGIIVARVFSSIPPDMFLKEMFTIVRLGDFLIGLMKTLVFGWIIVFSSGYKGFSVKQGAAEVGIATTDSVVLSISMIIIMDCIFALLLY